MARVIKAGNTHVNALSIDCKGHIKFFCRPALSFLRKASRKSIGYDFSSGLFCHSRTSVMTDSVMFETFQAHVITFFCDSMFGFLLKFYKFIIDFLYPKSIYISI